MIFDLIVSVMVSLGGQSSKWLVVVAGQSNGKSWWPVNQMVSRGGRLIKW